MPSQKDTEELHLLLLTLWDKAVGTEDYDKEQWQRLQELIQEHFPRRPH
jgi:hypothetical protein